MSPFAVVIIAWGAICTVWGALLLSQSIATRRGLQLRPAPLTGFGHTDDVPTVCVVVAARNEEATIADCAAAALAQDYRRDRIAVVVVDDRSDDGTAGAVEGLARHNGRLRLVRVSNLPPGWMGKSHALWRGTRGVDADWLLFTDADCILDPCALRTAMLEAGLRRVDMLSLWPRNAAVGFWEHLIIPLCGGIIALWFGSLRPDRSRSKPFANGQFILIRRAAYERIDGHRGVRDCLIEDVPLAERARDAGVASWVAGGRDLVAVRMYDGLRATLDGWARIYVGALRSGTRMFLSVFWLLVGSLFPFVLAPFLLHRLLTRGPDPQTLALAGMCLQHLLLVAAVSYRFWGMGGCDRRYLWLYPLSVVIVAGILARAAWWLLVRRRVGWRDRSYAIDGRARIVPAPGDPAARPRQVAWLAWLAWLALAGVAAFGLRHYRVENNLEHWVPDAAAVGAHKSYAIVGWDTAACDPGIVANVLRNVNGVAFSIDPATVGMFGRLAGVTPEDFVLSPDHRHAGTFCFPRPDVSDDALVRAIREALAADPRTAPVRFAVGGPAAYRSALDRVSQQGLPLLMAGIPVVGLLALWWVIGRFGHALAAVAAISLSQVALLGIIGWLRMPVDMSVSMVPPMMMCLGFSYAAHRSLRGGSAGTLAVCAVTTAAGIGGFAFTPLAPVRQFALFGMLGLALVWAAAATLLPPPVHARRVWLRAALVPLTALRESRIGRLAVLAAATAVAAAALPGATSLQFEQDALTFFPAGTREIDDIRWLDRNLTGMLPFQVTISPGYGGAGGAMLDGTPGVRKVIDVSLAASLVDATTHVGRTATGDGEGDGVARTYWCLADNDAFTALARAQPHWQRWAADHGARLEWRGVAAQLAGAQRTVLRASASSLPGMVVLAALATAFVAPSGRRERLRAAVVGGSAAAFPAAALVALAAATGLPLGIPSLMIGAIAVGVAVDDTLHLTSCARRHAGNLRRAALDCWRPCAGSSLVAVSTLALFALAPFGPTRQFGVLMAAGVLLGIFANHLLATTLLRAGTRRGRTEPGEAHPRPAVGGPRRQASPLPGQGCAARYRHCGPPTDPTRVAPPQPNVER